MYDFSLQMKKCVNINVINKLQFIYQETTYILKLVSNFLSKQKRGVANKEKSCVYDKYNYYNISSYNNNYQQFNYTTKIKMMKKVFAHNESLDESVKPTTNFIDATKTQENITL